MYYGILFDNIHSFNDLGLTIVEKKIGNPKKIKRKKRVPFSNIDLDFSKLYGDQEYESRELSYTFNVYDKRTHNKVDMNILKIKALNSFVPVDERVPLFDDAIPGYHFLAEVVDEPDFEERNGKGLMTVTFDAYSFKISNEAEGNDIWDIFNFELDIAQITKHDIRGQQQVTMFNIGATSCYPKIIASSNMTIQIGNTVYDIKQGTTETKKFNIKKGENKMLIKGNGTIEFIWFKEVI